MDTTEISQSLLDAAEECYKTRDFDGAIELMEHVIHLPNSSDNHDLFSRYLVAYSVHSSVSEDRTHYETLNIFDPFCDQRTINRRFKEIVVKLDLKRNPSVAAKSALKMVCAAWNVLSDPARRRVYNIERRLVEQTMQRKKRGDFLRYEKPEKLARTSSH